MNQSGAFECCWSCEGHQDSSEVPRIWFYAGDAVFVELLADHAFGLSAKRELTSPWMIEFLGNLGHFDAPLLQFAPSETSHSLEALQNDVRVLARRLDHVLRDRMALQVARLEVETS